MNEIVALYKKSSDPAEFAAGYLGYLTRVLAQMDTKSIGKFIEALVDARERGARVYFIGNGGSASTASHFANDLGIGTRTWHKPLRAVSLCDNSAVMTALANDYGYSEIFIRQLQVQMLPGDVVVAISASGNSQNIVDAVRYANSNGATTVGLTGFSGGELGKISNLVVHAPTNVGEYGPAEDVHMILDHLVGAFLLNFCAVEPD
ncbi:MAG: SIS domain-containing protein [Gemmatimonadaceae bacterium]|nr:SIS domain-containing protein [Gemmatimonadaceae bacterium]